VTGFINPVMSGFSIFAKDFGLNPSVLNLTFLFLRLRDMHFLKFDSVLVFKEISAVLLGTGHK